MGSFAIYNLYSYLTKHTILIFSLNVMCILEQMFVEYSLRIHQFIFTVVMLGKFPKCGQKNFLGEKKNKEKKNIYCQQQGLKSGIHAITIKIHIRTGQLSAQLRVQSFTDLKYEETVFEEKVSVLMGLHLNTGRVGTRDLFFNKVWWYSKHIFIENIVSHYPKDNMNHNHSGKCVVFFIT